MPEQFGKASVVTRDEVNVGEKGDAVSLSEDGTESKGDI